MSAPAGFPWWVGPVAWLGAGVVRLLGATWRIETTGDDPSLPGPQKRAPCIFVFWHSGLIPLIYTHRGRGIAVLSGGHTDAEIVVRAINRLGFVSARGSSTRGFRRGVVEMLEFAAAGHCLALTPDGPRGPAEVLKPGTAFLAGRSGVPVVPLATASSSHWMTRSWDRMRIPRPFSRVRLEFGAPIAVPSGLDEEGLEQWRKRIESALRELNARTRTAIGEDA